MIRGLKTQSPSHSPLLREGQLPVSLHQFLLTRPYTRQISSSPFFWSMQRTAGMLSDREQASEDETLKLSLLLSLFDAIITYSIGEAYRPAYYLPADRTGVMHAHRVVVRSLIERATAGGLRRTSPMPALSGVMADFLEQLISFRRQSTRKTQSQPKVGE